MIAGNLLRSGENRDSNGDIKATSLFGQFGWGEIDGDSSGGKIKVGVDNGAAHTVFTFFYRRFRQADHMQAGQAVG